MEPPSSLGDPLISLPCSSLLLQMLLFTAALSRDLCSCFSLLLLSVSMLSLCNLTYRPKFKFPFPVARDLHICFPAPSLPAEASLSLTPPKRQPPPPAAAQRGGSRAGTLGGTTWPQEHAACPTGILGESLAQTSHILGDF